MNVTDKDGGKMHIELFLEGLEGLLVALRDRLVFFFGRRVPTFSPTPVQVTARGREWHQDKLDDCPISPDQPQQAGVSSDMQAACCVRCGARWAFRNQVERVTQGLEEDLAVMIAADDNNRPSTLNKWLKDALDRGYRLAKLFRPAMLT